MLEWAVVGIKKLNQRKVLFELKTNLHFYGFPSLFHLFYVNFSAHQPRALDGWRKYRTDSLYTEQK